MTDLLAYCIGLACFVAFIAGLIWDARRTVDQTKAQPVRWILKRRLGKDD